LNFHGTQKLKIQVLRTEIHSHVFSLLDAKGTSLKILQLAGDAKYF
jgi:hypothetical protein